MNVAIDISPLETGHKVRGTGFYLFHLKEALLKYHSDISYAFFNKENEISLDTDIVHYPYFEPFFKTLPLFKRKKTIVTVHDLTPLVFPQHFPAGIKGKFKWLYQKKMLQQVDAVITDSESSRKDIIRIAGVSEKKISAIYLAADETFTSLPNKEVATIRKKYDLPEQFILYVGDATWNKNLPRLMQAVKKTSHQLILVGKVFEQENIDLHNDWNKDLLQARKMLHECTNIRTLGFVSSIDLPGIYNAATMLAMPSLYEGFGLPILEAMQSGCPVLTSRAGSLAEVAEEAAFYIDPFSIENIVSGIEQIMEKETLRKQLSEKGLNQAKKFSWKRTAGQTVDIYKQVIDSK